MQKNHIRFIAINDHFDTVEEENGNRAMMISIKNLVNDMYARDISRKMSGIVRDCIRRGSYVGSNAPYGYHVIKNDIGYGFEIDEETSKIVVWMYERYLELGNLHELAREMTQKRIRTPGIILSHNRYIWRRMNQLSCGWRVPFTTSSQGKHI